MKELNGISASPGIFIGRVLLYKSDIRNIPEYGIHEDELSREMERFQEASQKALVEIESLRSKFEKGQWREDIRFLDAHILMIQDVEFQKALEANLHEHKKNIEWVLSLTSDGYVRMLKDSGDPYMAERAIDLYDVTQRVINHLLYRQRVMLNHLDEEVVLVTHDLLPSDTLSMDKSKVRGIAMDAGGKTSHTAILARSFEIPAVLGLLDVSLHVNNGDLIIIDGNKGRVVINPDKDTRSRYVEMMHKWQKREVQLLTLNELPAETRDGKRIELHANIEVPEETDSVMAHGADGIGLYRSEFLFMQPSGVASEDQQYEAYSRVLKAMGDRPVTIRTLDVGGDKVIPGLSRFEEKNPILGWRAVRFCMDEKSVFRIQLRALLRASVHGRMRIMFPMISGAEELDGILGFYEQIREELSREGVPVADDLPIGVMIEVPSAAMTSDILAKKVDFFSIGTNDLIQYTMAVDRGNEKIAYLYEPFHPGVIRLIQRVIENAHAEGIPVSMCGEMAGDPLASVILLGLGLDGFSMSSFGIPEVKQILRSVTMRDAENLVGTILEMDSYKKIDTYVKEWMSERFEVFNE